MAEPGDGSELEPEASGGALFLMTGGSGGGGGGGEGDAEELVEVVDLEPSGPDDLANEMEDVDLDEEEAAWEDEEEEEEEEEVVEEGMEAQDDSEVTFSKHTASVFCVKLDPKTNTLAVTGGEDDKAFVWRLSDGETLFECTGHKDSVTCAGFSYDSTYVATGDMSGLIKVWQVDTKEEIWSFEVGDLEWMEWHPMSHVLLAGTADGNVWMWKIPGGECKTFEGPNCPATCGHVLPDGKRAVVGYEDGTVRIWDLKQGRSLYVLKGDEQGPQLPLRERAARRFVGRQQQQDPDQGLQGAVQEQQVVHDEDEEEPEVPFGQDIHQFCVRRNEFEDALFLAQELSARVTALQESMAADKFGT